MQRRRQRRSGGACNNDFVFVTEGGNLLSGYVCTFLKIKIYPYFARRHSESALPIPVSPCDPLDTPEDQVPLGEAGSSSPWLRVTWKWRLVWSEGTKLFLFSLSHCFAFLSCAISPGFVPPNSSELKRIWEKPWTIKIGFFMAN